MPSRRCWSTGTCAQARAGHRGRDRRTIPRHPRAPRRARGPTDRRRANGRTSAGPRLGRRTVPTAPAPPRKPGSRSRGRGAACASDRVRSCAGTVPARTARRRPGPSAPVQLGEPHVVADRQAERAGPARVTISSPESIESDSRIGGWSGRSTSNRWILRYVAATSSGSSSTEVSCTPFSTASSTPPASTHIDRSRAIVPRRSVTGLARPTPPPSHRGRAHVVQVLGSAARSARRRPTR